VPDLDLSFSCWQIVKDENAEAEVGAEESAQGGSRNWRKCPARERRGWSANRKALKQEIAEAHRRGDKRTREALKKALKKKLRQPGYKIKYGWIYAADDTPNGSRTSVM
jgi:hypothetical protein